MTKYIHKGSRIIPEKDENIVVKDGLGVGYYTISVDPYENLFIDTYNELSVPTKVYGDFSTFSDRVIRTFSDRKKNTGVLLSGLKGTGKSLTAKIICQKAIEQGYPVIVINKDLVRYGLVDFLTLITDPVVVLFDEFEKVYQNESQEAILTLLDGTSTAKKLYVCTTNETDRINTNMINRPGRIYFHRSFHKIDAEVAKEYAIEALDNKAYITDLLKVHDASHDLTFDALSAIVEECNRTGLSPTHSVKDINVSLTFDPVLALIKVTDAKTGEKVWPLEDYSRYVLSHEDGDDYNVISEQGSSPSYHSSKTVDLTNFNSVVDPQTEKYNVVFKCEIYNYNNYISLHSSPMISLGAFFRNLRIIAGSEFPSYHTDEDGNFVFHHSEWGGVNLHVKPLHPSSSISRNGYEKFKKDYYELIAG